MSNDSEDEYLGMTMKADTLMKQLTDHEYDDGTPVPVEKLYFEIQDTDCFDHQESAERSYTVVCRFKDHTVIPKIAQREEIERRLRAERERITKEIMGE